MYNLYERIIELCNARKITPYRMCKDIGMQPSVITDLKMGRKKTVHAETAGKIAEYFNVSTDYLLGKEKSPAIKDNDEAQISDEVLELAKIISNLPNDKKKTMLDLIDLLRDGAEKP